MSEILLLVFPEEQPGFHRDSPPPAPWLGTTPHHTAFASWGRRANSRPAVPPLAPAQTFPQFLPPRYLFIFLYLLSLLVYFISEIHLEATNRPNSPGQLRAHQ